MTSQQILYLDNAATTRIYPEVLKQLNEDFATYFANPASSHRLGNELKEKILNIKSQFLIMLNGNKKDHFYFTSSATESNNTVISGIKLAAGETVLYSKADHPSVVLPVEKLKEKGMEVVAINLLTSGSIDLEWLEKILLEKKISLAVFSQVNHQSGNIHDVNKLAKLIKGHSPRAHIHIDAVQAFGKIEVKLAGEIDSMSITAHKIGGPKGIAGLYLKNNHSVKPLLIGGGQQEDFRAGTENYPLVNAFFMASKLTLQNSTNNFLDTQSLQNMLKENIIRMIPSAQFIFEDTSPYILSFLIPGISSDILLRHLEVKNIFIGSTSACSSRIKALNPTLLALNIPEKLHKNILRVSFGTGSTQNEIQHFTHEFQAIWNELRFLVK